MCDTCMHAPCLLRVPAGTAPTEEDASTRIPLSAGGSSPEYSQNTPGMASGSAECGSKAAVNTCHIVMLP